MLLKQARLQLLEEQSEFNVEQVSSETIPTDSVGST